MKKKSIFLISVGIIFSLVAWGCLAWFMFNDARQDKGINLEAQESKDEGEQQQVDNLKDSDSEKSGDDILEKEVIEDEAKSNEAKAEDKTEEKLTEKKKDDSGKEKDQEAEKKKERETKVGLVSWGYSTSGRKAIDTIIVHSVYNSLGGEQYNLSKILDIFKSYNVSAHYIIDREGTVHQLVNEKHVSWHAGSGKMPDGRTDINNFSIGVEIINAENDRPTAEQYSALSELIKQIKARNKIKYVLGHNDVAPGRKTDPWNFDWNRIGGKEK